MKIMDACNDSVAANLAEAVKCLAFYLFILIDICSSSVPAVSAVAGLKTLTSILSE
jgi:hypothetical protein